MTAVMERVSALGKMFSISHVLRMRSRRRSARPVEHIGLNLYAESAVDGAVEREPDAELLA